MRTFLALSFFFHSAAFAYLYLVSKPEDPQPPTLHSVEIENPHKRSAKSGLKKQTQKTAPYQAEYGLADPSLKKGPHSSGLEMGSETMPSQPGISFNGRSLENKRESNTGGFDTGFGSKSHSTLESHEIKISKLLNLENKAWIDKYGKRTKLLTQALKFFKGELSSRTWYTLGLGSRLPDESEKKELIYYLRRLELKVFESGTPEQEAALKEVNQKIYESLEPDLKTYWDSLTNNYRVLNDWKRSPE